MSCIAAAIRAGTVVEEIESLHLFEGEQRVLLVDDVITQAARPIRATTGCRSRSRRCFAISTAITSVRRVSSSMSKREIISYEEYHPYGTSAYRLMNAAVEAPPKRYRYTGMERDEESGLGYHSARYYVPWLGRWCSADPSGTRDGVNLYAYCRNNPVMLIDEDGQLPTLVLGLIGAAAGGLIGVGYALATGKDPVKYGVGFAVLGGAAGLTLGMSMTASAAAGGTWKAGALAWGTRAVIGAGMSSSRQAVEQRAGRRSELSVVDMVFESVMATAPVPTSVAIPAGLTIGTVELAKGSAAAKQGEGEMALFHTLTGSASLLSGGSQLMKGGGTPGPLVPAGATAIRPARSR